MKNTKKILLFFFLSISFSFGQEINKLLGKAFTSQDSSAYYFYKAKQIAQSESDIAEYYFCKNARCTDYNQLDSATVYGKIALEKFIKIKKFGSALSVINNLSKANQIQGHYDKAIEITLKGLQIAEMENNEYWKIMFNISLSRNHHDFESYEKGVFYGKNGFELSKNAKKINNDIIACALSVIAINYDDWNKPEKALEYHKKTLQYQKNKDTLKLAGTYNNIGNTLQKQKKYKEALSWFNRSLKIHQITLQKKDDSYYYNFATVYTNLATNAYKLNKFDDAEKLFQKAKFFSIKSNDIEKIRDYYYQSTKFYKEQKNLVKVIETQENYLQLRDSVFNKDRDKNFAEIETKYQSAKKEKQLLQNKIEAEKRNYIIIGLSILVGFISLIGFLIYRQQKLKNKQQIQEFQLKSAIDKMESQNQLHEQRLSISRDLHDNIGAQLTFIISSVDNLKYGFKIKDEKINSQLNKINNFTKSTIIELRDTIWAMNSDEITFQDIEVRMYNFIEKAKQANENIQIDFIIDSEFTTRKLNALEGINLYRTIQEAINNALKYSKSNQIIIKMFLENKKNKITISDNGVGFNIEEVNLGNGILNMQKRMEEINSSFAIKSSNSGTEIILILNQNYQND